MPYKLKDKLVVAISSRALFNLEKENEIYETEGLAAYTEHQIRHEDEALNPGTAYSLVQALLDLNHVDQEAQVEVIILSRNSPSTGLRVFNAIEKRELDIRRAAFTGGEKISKYLEALKVDLFFPKIKGTCRMPSMPDLLRPCSITHRKTISRIAIRSGLLSMEMP